MAVVSLFTDYQNEQQRYCLLYYQLLWDVAQVPPQVELENHRKAYEGSYG